MSTIEKLFETILTMALIYAVYCKNRKLMLAWQVIAPLMFLFNILHIVYISIKVVNLNLFLFIAVPMSAVFCVFGCLTLIHIHVKWPTGAQ
ncbi:hypothetical protein ACLKA6_016382 [Drosophila palustris]